MFGPLSHSCSGNSPCNLAQVPWLVQLKCEFIELQKLCLCCGLYVAGQSFGSSIRHTFISFFLPSRLSYFCIETKSVTITFHKITDDDSSAINYRDCAKSRCGIYKMCQPTRYRCVELCESCKHRNMLCWCCCPAVCIWNKIPREVPN